MSLSRRKHKLWVSLLTVLIMALAGYLQTHPAKGRAIVAVDPAAYAISNFVDGDTIAISMNGGIEKVRFIGIDTPETHKPNTPVQCYGPAASAYTKTMIGNQRVRLEADSLGTNRDRYNRLLRYVYLPDGTLLNQKIIETGHGFYYPYFPYSKSEDFKAAQASAKAANLGLWGNCNPIAKAGGGYVSNSQ